MLKINFVVIKNALIGNIVKAPEFPKGYKFSSSNRVSIDFLINYEHSWIATNRETIFLAGDDLDKQCLCLSFDSNKEAIYYKNKYQKAIEEFNKKYES